MSPLSSQKSILIVEPNLDLEKPYSFLDPQIFKVTRVSNTLLAASALEQQNFELVLLSCSFSNKKLLNFLDSLKLASKNKIIPLVLVVDFNQPYSIVPGLSWDKQVGLLSSSSCAKELMTVLARLL